MNECPQKRPCQAVKACLQMKLYDLFAIEIDDQLAAALTEQEKHRKQYSIARIIIGVHSDVTAPDFDAAKHVFYQFPAPPERHGRLVFLPAFMPGRRLFQVF